MKIIAEMGASHCGRYELAWHLIAEAKNAGADAVKLQCFEPEQMAVEDYVIQSGPWAGRNLQDLYRVAHTPKRWFSRLFDFAREIGIEIFSSVYHPDDVAFLETLGCPAYKIASFEAHWDGLLQACLDTGKHVYVSAGLLTEQGIARLDSPQITAMHCVSAYPAADSDMNIGVIGESCLTGLSDHTRGSLAAQLALARGATCVEKHIQAEFVEGLDSGFAMKPMEFRGFVSDVRRAERMLGSGDLCHRTLPASSMALRRSRHPDGTVRRPWSGSMP